MNRLSPWQTAAILMISRVFALSLYEPLTGENTVLTAVCALMLCAVKWALLIPAQKIVSSHPEFRNRISAGVLSVLTVIGAAVLLTVLTDSFASMLEAVYPERYSRFGITTVLLLISAYTASMGRQGLARAAVLMLPVFLATLTLVFFEIRPAMLPDRMSLYSPDPGKAVPVTLMRLPGGSADVFLALTLLPVTDKPKTRSAAVYLAGDALISLGFFMTAGAVLGGFRSGAGSLWFTLSYCTHGSVIDRSGAVFLTISTACAVVTCAALLLVMSRSLGYLTKSSRTNPLLLCPAALLTALLLAVTSRGLSPQLLNAEASFAVSVLTLAAAFAAPIYSRRRERTA